MPVIKLNFPEKMPDFEFAIKNSEKYYLLIKEEVKNLQDKYKLEVKELVAHNKH